MFKKMLQNYDYSLVAAVLLLSGFGLVMVYSASYGSFIVVASDLESDYFFKKQLLALGVGLVAFVLAMIFPYKAYQPLIKVIVPFAAFLLIYVLVYGKVSNNAQSWISIAGFQFQPSELVKICLILYLASVFSKKQHYISDFSRGVAPPLIVIMLFFILILKQPDLGTAMIVAGISGLMIICSGMQFKHWASLFALAAAGVALLFFQFLTPEQASRITAAYDPFSDPRGAGNQLINAYYAIASGGLTGRGLGESIQKFGYLYASHTDLIIAIIAEELGVFGVFFTLFLLAFIVFKGFLIGMRSHDTFGSLLAIGIASFIGVQSVVNLGAASGLLPITGIPLPFVSYGGSSLVVLLFSMGILVNVSMFVNLRKERRNQQKKPLQTFR